MTKRKSKITKALQEALEFAECHRKMFPVVDYHDFSYPSCSLEHRRKFDIGSIYINGAICKLCGWFIRSRNRHDFVTCKCGAVSVDGGSWYCKRSGRPETYQNVIVLFDIQENDTKH